MHTISVDVDIDPADVIEELSAKELAELGLTEIAKDSKPSAIVDALRFAVARRDLNAVLDNVEKLARDEGLILDTTPLRTRRLQVAA